MLRDLYNAGGIFDFSTPYGYIYTENSFLIPQFMVAGEDSRLMISEIGINIELDVDAAAEYSVLNASGRTVHKHFGEFIEIGIK